MPRERFESSTLTLESRQSNTEPIDNRRIQVNAIARVISAHVQSAAASRSAPREIRVSRAPLQPPLHAVTAHKTAATIQPPPQDGFPSDRDQHAAATTQNSDTMPCSKNQNLFTLVLHDLNITLNLKTPIPEPIKYMKALYLADLNEKTNLIGLVPKPNT